MHVPLLPVSAIAATLIASALQIAHAQPSKPSPHLDPMNRTLWGDDGLGVRFTYPPVWQKATATQPSTRVVINWRLAKSKALLASCYLETHGTSSLARADPSQIHKNIDSISRSALQNLQMRAPNAHLIEARAAIQDGHPIIFLIREGTVEGLDRKYHNKVYSIVTAWRGTEVNFECGTSIYGPEYTSLEGGQRLIDQVETGILHVLKTLQFDRIAR